MIVHCSNLGELLATVKELDASGVPASEMIIQADSHNVRRSGFWQRLRNQRAARREREADHTAHSASLRGRQSEAKLYINHSCDCADVLSSIIVSQGKLSRASDLDRTPTSKAASVQTNSLS